MMHFEEVNELNKIKIIGFVLTLLCFAIVISAFTLFFMGKIDFFTLWISIPAAAIISFFAIGSLGKIKRTMVSYVLKQCPDWEKEDKKEENSLQKVLFSDENVFSIILPIYNNKKEDIDISEVFCHRNDILRKNIAKIEHKEQKKIIKKDENGHENVHYKTIYQFAATMIAVKNPKNLNSVTYFKTNNYPDGTSKKIMEEKSKLVLPKMELPNAMKYDIDIYTDNQTVAEKLATQELFETLQNIKKRLNLLYIKAVFYDDNIFFILRDKNMETSSAWTFPLFIKISFFNNIDHPLIDQAIDNFTVLTDLANRALEFTQNI